MKNRINQNNVYTKHGVKGSKERNDGYSTDELFLLGAVSITMCMLCCFFLVII